MPWHMRMGRNWREGVIGATKAKVWGKGVAGADSYPGLIQSFPVVYLLSITLAKTMCFTIAAVLALGNPAAFARSR